MNKVLLTAILLVILTCTSCIRDWRRSDQQMFGGYVVTELVDIKQTRTIMDDSNNFYELNGMLDGLSRDQATAVMVGTTFLLYFMVDQMPADYRTWFLGSVLLGKVFIINHNYNIGVRY